MTAALTLLMAAGLLLFVVGRAAPMPSMSLVAPNGTRPRDVGWFTGLSAVVVVLAAVTVLAAVAGTVAGWAPGSATTTIRSTTYDAISTLVVGAGDVGDVAGSERPSGEASGLSGALLVELSATRAASGAESAAQGARLRTHLRLTQDYGAGGVRELADGRIRYYDVLDPARKPGTMAGRRLVREWDPATGRMRTWHETLDHQGRIRQVRPVDQTRHYTFDEVGNYTRYWPE